MFLEKVIFTNFRGINESKEIIISNFNTIVGRNDTGKSTILKALDLFLNNNEASKEMKNINSTTDIVEIELFLRLKVNQLQ